ncbi:MAG: hypothetical protein ABMA64_02120 [Myxococcota bacterium]
MDLTPDVVGNRSGWFVADRDGDWVRPDPQAAPKTPTPSPTPWIAPTPMNASPVPAVDQTFVSHQVMPKEAQRRGAKDTLFSAQWFQNMPADEAAEWRAVLNERSAAAAPAPRTPRPMVLAMVLAALAGAGFTVLCGAVVVAGAAWWFLG